MNAFLAARPAPDLLAAASLGALSVAAAALALSAPPAVPALAATAAAGAAVAALLPRRRQRLAGEPVAITDDAGTLVAATDAFAALLAAEGLPPDPAALARNEAGALALYLLRRRAVAEGSASGLFPPFSLTITADSGTLAHRVTRARPAEPATGQEAEALLALLPVPAAVVDEHGAILAANGPFGGLVGAPKTLDDAFTLQRDAIPRLAREAAAGRLARVDADMAQAESRRIRLSAKSFPRPAGPPAFLVTVADVTEQSELEAQIAQSQKMQAIGQLAGGIAHDFNNVLTAIIGYSDLLLQSHRPSDPAFRDIMNIKQNAQRAARLVKQLLAFSRRQTLRPAVLDLNAVLADLSLMLDRLLGERVKLDITYGRDLWPVLADLSQVEQVVINLAVNARDAMPGGGTLTVRTSNVPAGTAAAEDVAADAVLIEIEDTGTGIAPEILGKIFEPFFTTKATGKGTGLGLSTVYGIVKQTGGTLDVASRAGEGTVFRVYLPRTEAAPAAIEAPVTRGDLTGSATVLLAEDEEAIRAFASRALEAKGYRVLAAATGEEAAEIYAAEGGAIDLLLTDVIMPELDGPGLVERLRAEGSDVKVIFMSGYADGASVDDLGAASFLPKPFTLKALAEAVKAELSVSAS